MLTGSQDSHKKINYHSTSLGGWGALGHLPSSKMVLVRNRLRQAVLQLRIILVGKKLLGKTWQVTRKYPGHALLAMPLHHAMPWSSKELQMPVGPSPGGVSDTGGTKRGKKHFTKKLEVLWQVAAQQSPGLVSCSTNLTACCVLVTQWGHRVMVLQQRLVRESCNLLPTARCRDLQGPMPLLCTRLKSGSAD